MSQPRACPLPRWPQALAALRARGLRVHHLAAALGVSPSQAWAWLYGRQDMPPDQRRRAEDFLGLPVGSLSA